MNYSGILLQIVNFVRVTGIIARDAAKETKGGGATGIRLNKKTDRPAKSHDGREETKRTSAAIAPKGQAQEES